MRNRLYWLERGKTLPDGCKMSIWSIWLTYEDALTDAVMASREIEITRLAIYVRPENNFLPPAGQTPIWIMKKKHCQAA